MSHLPSRKSWIWRDTIIIPPFPSAKSTKTRKVCSSKIPPNKTFTKHIPFGVASGGKYGDEKGCASYPFPPCHHPCHVQPTPTCPLKSESAQCQGDEDEHTRNEVAQHIDKLVHCPDGDYDCMAREIYNSGPVSSYAGTIYDEFYAYKDGAYRTSTDSETRGRSHGGHVIEVIGWQKESDGTYSWKIINSWLNWGDKGHGRIAVGELSIGDSVESATMLADTNVAR